jgi:hypothetical protein
VLSRRNVVDSLSDRIAETVRENEKFLLGRYGRSSPAYDEVLALVNSAEKYVEIFMEEGESSGRFSNSCLRPYVFLIMRPFSYAVLADLLTSNVVACFMELRLMVESFVKFYYADLTYPKQVSFREKIRMLQEEIRDQEKSMADLIEKCGWDKIVKGVRFLWRQLSEGWLHTKGIVDRIVDEVTSNPNLPAWLGEYRTYTDADSNVLGDLRKTVAVFRRVQAEVLEHWLHTFH